MTAAIRALNNTTPGADDITAPLLKDGGDAVTDAMHRIVLSCWATSNIPTPWKHSSICPIYKKGPSTVCGNHRGISLLSIPGKVYTHILFSRVRRQLEPHLSTYQFGFRPGRGTTEAIFTLRRLQEESHRSHAPLHAAYVDLSKAFDRVNHDALWETLLHRGVHPDLLARLKSLYSGATASARVGGASSAPFPLTTGVRQGCPLSPLLFNIYIDTVIRSLLARLPGAGIRIGYSINGTLHTPKPGADYATVILPLLLYADDIVLLAPTADNLHLMLSLLHTICTDLAMSINFPKTESQALGHPSEHAPPAPISIPSTSPQLPPHLVQPTSKFKYLGSILSTPIPDGDILDAEISRRISSAAHAFRRLTTRIWSSTALSRTNKIVLYQSLVLPVLLTACQTWTMNKSHIHRLEVVHNRYLRRLKGVPAMSPLTTEEMHALHPPTVPVSNTIDKLKASFIGSLVRQAPPYPPSTALYSHGRPDFGRPAGGLITSYRDNARELFTSARFATIAKAKFDEAKARQIRCPAQPVAPALAAILQIRACPSWEKLATSTTLWRDICCAIGGA